ncbi:MAG: hypothetical protein L6Q84_23525 [Polyangiaceae bacterium]|nr:hypothetical protein [Polyangiaceae bacterium]
MFEPKSFAHSAAALRAKLAALRFDDAPEPAPLSFGWCAPPARLSPEVLRDVLATVAPGCSVAVLLADGRVLVADVLVAGPVLALRLWGRSRATRVPAVTVRSLAVVGPHTHAEAAEVRRRQARGEPVLWAGCAQPAKATRLASVHGAARSCTERRGGMGLARQCV